MQEGEQTPVVSNTLKKLSDNEDPNAALPILPSPETMNGGTDDKPETQLHPPIVEDPGEVDIDSSPHEEENCDGDVVILDKETIEAELKDEQSPPSDPSLEGPSPNGTPAVEPQHQVDIDGEESEAKTPTKRELMPEEEVQQLDSAFQNTTPIPPPPQPTEPEEVTDSRLSVNTPIPKPALCIRLLRRFAKKTRPKILTQYGGTQSRSILRYIFGRNNTRQDSTFMPYKTLMDIILEDYDEEEEMEDESNSYSNVEDANDFVLESPNDKTQVQANEAVAAFVDLFSVWGHASSGMEKNAALAFQDLQVAILDGACNLVDYGCLSGVSVKLSGDEYHSAASLLASSVFNSDLTSERVELASMKFLLGTGCRPDLLRGSYLLQSIRTFYHVYLTTEFRANKVTARAALQQLIMSVFARVVHATGDAEPVENFPSADHRDVYLVLRSLCKLSMRTLPSSEMHSHVGLQTSASNDTWAGDEFSNGGVGRTPSGVSSPSTHSHAGAQLIYTSAIHPALESKLLALELMLYVLQNTPFDNEFCETSGPQFHAAIRNYLCVSLLKNCISDTTRVVSLSLSIFVPTVRHFRTVLKTEIEAFVTNVFFVILDSKNSSNEHKSLVVRTFQEIGSDPHTLAEIFLNYDCDLSAVDLFHRIVNTLSKLSRLQEPTTTKSLLGFSGPSEAQMEKVRTETRELRLAAMKALRQILASLHASIVEPMKNPKVEDAASEPASPKSPGGQNLVELYGSKKKRRAEESEAILRFNRKPSAGIAYAAKCGHIDPEDASDVARYLLKNKDELEKTQIGEYLGREAEYQGGFSLKVLHEYVRLMDFTGLVFDDAIRFFLSGFRLPGEAQKIDRIMEKFAERFTEQNPSVFPTADAAFILSFSIIMLNTDLHNPAIKEERRMTKDGFVRNNRGICDGQDLPQEMLTSIFDRIKENPISLKEDDEARERVGDNQKGNAMGLPAALSPASFFTSHYDDMDRARETNFQKERDHIVRTTESLLKRRRHGVEKSSSKRNSMRGSRQPSRFVLSEHSGLKDEYVSPMLEVTWGPALAAFSTAMESANGTAGVLISIASDEELELAAENAAETIEVCLTGFRFAIGTAGLCGNSIARDSFMSALSRFSQLGTGVLLEPRHLRATQTMLSLAREDGELLGGSWEHVFKALSEINRFHQMFQMLARNDRAAAAATERRRRRLEEKERRRLLRDERKASVEDGESLGGDSANYVSESEDDDDSLAESGLFSEDADFDLEENMDAKEIDEANAREVYEAVSESTIEAIYERSSSLSAPAVQEFFSQLCAVSRSEISVGTNSQLDLNQVTYRQKHALLNHSEHNHGDQFHHTQPNIYNLQKLVEATHYNMASRTRLLFADLWVTVANHLTGTALHSNPAIAMYAVDSFRQLSIQYLQRDELEVFEFQKRFLKPLETIMAQSSQSSTKELLLSCVARLIHVFGSTDSTTQSQAKGGLRSGWVPLLTILGLGGQDSDAGIAQLSFKTLSGEIKQCLYKQSSSNLLLSDYFVETVNAVLATIGGPHDEVSSLAIEQLKALADTLASSNYTIPNTRRKLANSSAPEHTSEESSKQKLGLWWPVLLGLSRLMGETRHSIREKISETLFGIILDHFVYSEEATAETLQLIYRGVLNSVLEFAESEDDEELCPIPDDFERLDVDLKDHSQSEGEHLETATWLETTFDQFMDNCIDVCKAFTKETGDPILIEEVFALMNSCLLSDSGALAVRGLRRLEQFVTSDLDDAALSDDVWATMSHMLQRSLSVRGLPKRTSQTEIEGMSEDEQKGREVEYQEAVAEFVAEDRYLPNRRCIGSNATMVVGQLLCSDRFSFSLRWRLFLVKWLLRAIRDWEAASEILKSDSKIAQSRSLVDYRETALYGRKWMNRLILQLAAMKEIGTASTVDTKDSKTTNRFAQGQKLVIDATENLLMTFVLKEEAVTQYNRKTAKLDEAIYKRYTSLVQEILSGFGSMDGDYLKSMEWLSPILLSSCIRSTNEEVRLMVQKVVDKTSPAAPTPKSVEAAGPVESLQETEPQSQDGGVEEVKALQSEETDALPVEDSEVHL